MAKGQKTDRKKGGKKRDRRNVPHGIAHVHATFNNTRVTIADPEGNVVSWASAGKSGFKGSRKGTPYAAQMAGSNAASIARDAGCARWTCWSRGPAAAVSRPCVRCRRAACR
jgi:small subunit ribosomal protein S11